MITKFLSQLAVVIVVYGTCAVGMCEEPKLPPFKIAVKKHRSIRSVLSPHSEPTVSVVINGKEFSNVKGNPPYYLPISEWGSIFFATEIGEAMQYHIVNVTNLAEVTVNGGGTHFGYAIGASRADLADHLFVLDHDKLKLTSTARVRNVHREVSLILDLKLKSVVSKEVEDFDNSGKTVMKKVIPTAKKSPQAQQESGFSIPKTNAVSIPVTYLEVEAPFETTMRKWRAAKLKKLEDKPEFGAFVNSRSRATKELVAGLEAFTTALDIPWNHGETNARCHVFYNERTHVIFLRGLSQTEFLRFTNALVSNEISFTPVAGPGAPLMFRSTK